MVVALPASAWRGTLPDSMSRRITLHPTSAAAAGALAAFGDGRAALVAGDVAQGFFAFTLELALRARPFRLPGEAERLVLARAAADRAGLSLPVPATAGFARALSDLHGSGLSPGALRRLGPPKGLSEVFEAHQQLLLTRGFLDVAQVPWVAADGVRAGLGSLGCDSLLVEPRLTWTQAELSLLVELGRVVAVEVRLPLASAEPTAALDAVHQELARAGGVLLTAAGAGEDTDLSRALQGLFARGAAPVQSPHVRAISFGSPVDEARAVAQRVRELLRSGLPPDSIAVTSLGPLGDELRPALLAAGVPVAAPPAALSSVAAGQLPLSVLAAAEEGIPRERLCELLVAGVLAVDGRRLGRQWARRLRAAGCGDHRSGRLFPPLEAALARAAAETPEAEQPEGLVELRRAVELLAALPQRAPADVHARVLWRALRELGIVDRLQEPVEERPVGPESQAGLLGVEVVSPASPAFGFASAWLEVARAEGHAATVELEGVLSSLASLGPGLTPVQAEDFAGLFRLACDRISVRRAPALAGGVAVAPAEALLGQRFAAVFLCGLSGGAGATSSVGDDTFLPERLRRQAREAHERPALLPSASAAAARAREKLLLCAAAGLSQQSLWASGCRTSGEKPLEPSPLLAEIARASAAGLSVESAWSWRASAPALLTRDEVCAVLPEALAAAAEPVGAALHARLRDQRHRREVALSEGRDDAYAGELSEPDLLAALAGPLAFEMDHPLSASSLERLAGCGFRALAGTVFGLRQPEEREEDLDSRDRGTLLHACLEHGFLALRAASLLPLCGGARRAQEVDVFLTAVRAELTAREGRSEVGHPAVWRAARRTTERELLRVLSAEQAATDGFVPTDFELYFGRDRETPILAVASGDVRLGGRIDRVDRAPGRLRVIDYKSGTLDMRNQRLRREYAGRELQLAHYALAFHLGEPDTDIDAAFYSVREAKLSVSLSKACEADGLTLATFLDASAQGRARARETETHNLPNHIEDALGRARAGHFPVAPGDCGYCDFAAACRVGGRYEEWE